MPKPGKPILLAYDDWSGMKETIWALEDEVTCLRRLLEQVAEANRGEGACDPACACSACAISQILQQQNRKRRVLCGTCQTPLAPLVLRCFRCHRPSRAGSGVDNGQPSTPAVTADTAGTAARDGDEPRPTWLGFFALLTFVIAVAFGLFVMVHALDWVWRVVVRILAR